MLEISDPDLQPLVELERIARRCAALDRVLLRLRKRQRGGQDVTLDLVRWHARFHAVNREYRRVEAIATPIALRLRAAKAD